MERCGIFFKKTGTGFSEADRLASRIREVMPTVLNDFGCEKYDEGFFEELTSKETTTKFRNPPAHTQFLSYDIACECREVFRNTILEFSKMLNER